MLGQGAGKAGKALCGHDEIAVEPGAAKVGLSVRRPRYSSVRAKSTANPANWFPEPCGRAENIGDEWGLRQLPDERMLASPLTDNQNLHKPYSPSPRERSL